MKRTDFIARVANAVTPVIEAAKTFKPSAHRLSRRCHRLLNDRIAAAILTHEQAIVVLAGSHRGEAEPKGISVYRVDAANGAHRRSAPLL